MKKGRPFKEGLDYFELDCRVDDKIRLIQAEFGLKGFAVVVLLYQAIYGGQGYYLSLDKKRLLLFMSENGIAGGDKNLIEEIIKACIKVGIFSEDLFKKYSILTSSGIQKRYFNAVSRRENVNPKKEYLLINVGNFRNNEYNNSISASNNSINVNNNSQRKEKKRKENNIVSSLRSDTKSAGTADLEEVVRLWNSLDGCGDVKPIRGIYENTKRIDSVRARLKVYGVKGFGEAVEAVRQSKFMQGQNKRGWVITFDWLIKPNNFPKVIEGNYDSKAAGGDALEDF